MAKTLSTMIPIGTKATDFCLYDVQSDHLLSLNALKSDTATVVMFLCNHCPFVKHIQSKLSEIVRNYEQLCVQFIAISSNDVTAYPQDGPQEMKQEALNHQYTFPYLYDETQAIAKAYQAACTPDFFIFDKNLACVYRGRFDDSTPGNNQPVTGIDLTKALDALLAGQPVDTSQMPSVGCNIKWK